MFMDVVLYGRIKGHCTTSQCFHVVISSFSDEISPLSTPLHNLRLTDQHGNQVVQSPQKPVNLLSEIPAPSSRKLNDREQRDCEVIGKP